MRVTIVGDFYGGGELGSLLDTSPESIINQNLLDEIRLANLAIVNLESPLTIATKPISKSGPALRADFKVAGFLKKAGFNLATLANNHIMDLGEKGLSDTFTHLKKSGLAFVGAGNSAAQAAEPYLYFTEERSLAVLNFCENEWSTTQSEEPGANPVDAIQNYYQIKAAKEKANFVVVIVHGGHEHYALPSPRVKKLYRFYVEAGADAVVGHHPHCISGYEKYRGAPIFYSLGNFMFSKPKTNNRPWNRGLMLHLNFKEGYCNFKWVHFNQMNGSPAVNEVSEEERKERDHHLLSLNEIILSDTKLAESYRQFLNSQYRMYNAYLEPHGNRYLQFLQNRNWFPSLWNNRKRTYLLNLIRCEAHRDVVLNLLVDENSHTQE